MAVSVVLTGYGVLDAGSAAVLMIVAVLAVALAISAGGPDKRAYRAAVSWALFGIIVVNASAGDWVMILICTAGIAALGTLSWLRSTTPASFP